MPTSSRKEKENAQLNRSRPLLNGAAYQLLGRQRYYQMPWPVWPGNRRLPE